MWETVRLGGQESKAVGTLTRSACLRHLPALCGCSRVGAERQHPSKSQRPVGDRELKASQRKQRAGADVKGMKGQRGGCGCEVSGEQEASRHASRAAALRWRLSEQVTRSAHGARLADQVGRSKVRRGSKYPAAGKQMEQGTGRQAMNGSLQGQQVHGGISWGECVYGRAYVRMPAELS